MSKRIAVSKTRQIAYNPITRRFEVVHPEDEVTGSEVITQYWSKGLQQWVCIPNE
jgi:hypothetical protein